MTSPHCPACFSKITEECFPYDIQQHGNNYLPDRYLLLKCNNCGLIFKDDLPSLENLRKHYGSIDTSISGWNYEERLPHEKKIDQILSDLPEGSKVLDVGCWTGRLLSKHRNRLEIYGIELNSYAAIVAGEHGLNILDSEVTKDLAIKHSLKCIILVDVFEHLPNPMEVFDNLLAALELGGELLIVTGRTDCLPCWMSGASYWYFNIPDHLVFLNRRFASWLRQRNSNVKVNYIPLRHFAFTWKRYLFEAVWLFCWRFLSPHSPFLKPPFHKIPGLKRFERLQQPVMCTAWKDHALIQVKKL